MIEFTTRTTTEHAEILVQQGRSVVAEGVSKNGLWYVRMSNCDPNLGTKWRFRALQAR